MIKDTNVMNVGKHLFVMTTLLSTKKYIQVSYNLYASFRILLKIPEKNIMLHHIYVVGCSFNNLKYFDLFLVMLALNLFGKQICKENNFMTFSVQF